MDKIGKIRQHHLLILEQYLGNHWEQDKKNKNNIFVSLNTDDLKFAELIDKPFEGLEFYRRLSNTSSELADGKNPFGSPLGYSRQIYRVTNEIGKEVKLTKELYSISISRFIFNPDFKKGCVYFDIYKQELNAYGLLIFIKKKKGNWFIKKKMMIWIS